MLTINRSVFAPSFITILFLLFTSPLLTAQTNAVEFSRKAYYIAFTSENLQSIQKQLDILSQSSQAQKDAFEGALMIRKAGLMDGISSKLKIFKAGREKLEAMIAAYPGNAEFRFLRLMIQENAPRLLGYNKQLEEDRGYLINHFKSIPEGVQTTVVDYSKSSKVLSPQDF